MLISESGFTKFINIHTLQLLEQYPSNGKGWGATEAKIPISKKNV